MCRHCTSNIHTNDFTAGPRGQPISLINDAFHVLSEFPLITVRRCNMQMCSESLTSSSNTSFAAVIIIRLFRNVPAVLTSSIFVLFLWLCLLLSFEPDDVVVIRREQNCHSGLNSVAAQKHTQTAEPWQQPVISLSSLFRSCVCWFIMGRLDVTSAHLSYQSARHWQKDKSSLGVLF